MNEFISKQTAVQALMAAYETGRIATMENVVSVLALVPAADVEPVRHGKWLDGKCTVCGWEEPDTYSYDGYEAESWEETPVCPNCGAKMDLEEIK